MSGVTEVLGTVSAVIAIAEASLKASSALHELFITMKDAPREIMILDRDISAFKSLVINLQAALKSDDVILIVGKDDEVRGLLEILLLPMKSCKEVCEEIHRKLQGSGVSLPASGGASDAQPKRFQLRFAKWHFMKKEVYTLLARFQGTKGIFSDAMGTLTLLLTFRIHSVISKEQSPNRAKDTQKFDDDAGSAFLQYTKLSHEAHPDLSKMPLPPRREKLNGPQYAKSLLEAVRDNEYASVEMMLGSINPDIRDPRNGRTALSIAAELGNLPMTELLLSHGANVNIRQYSLNKRQGEGFDGHPIVMSGRTPLQWAVVEEHVEIVKILLQHRANPNSRNSAGRTALQDACWKNNHELAKMLLEAGADVNGINLHSGWAPIHECSNGKSIDLLYVLLDYGALLDVPVLDPYYPDAFPIHFTTRLGGGGKLRILLASGADPNALMAEDISCLHLAAARGWVDGIFSLLDKGASINAQDLCLRETPLHKAARNCELNTIRVLCESGADTSIRNIDGQTYKEVLACAQQNPDDWRVDIVRASFCSYY